MHVPPGFAVVTPYLMADDAEGYIRFLTEAFGAHEIGRNTAPDGRIANSQLRFDGTTIMVTQATEAYPATQAAYYLYVGSADAAMARAEQAGAQRIMDVADMPYGDRQGGVRDPAGNVWWISQRLSPAPYY